MSSQCKFCRDKATHKLSNKTVTYPKYLCSRCLGNLTYGENTIVEKLAASTEVESDPNE